MKYTKLGAHKDYKEKHNSGNQQPIQQEGNRELLFSAYSSTCIVSMKEALIMSNDIMQGNFKCCVTPISHYHDGQHLV